MISLYKKGNTHTVRGIECEVNRIEFINMEDYLKNGWVKSPEELTEKKEEPKQIIDPIRLQAKEAGIEGWDIKRINTLKALLNDDKD